MDRDIILQDLTKQTDLWRLKDYLREIYRLLDRRQVSVDCAASITFDADEAESFYVELTANITSITIKHPYLGRRITLIFKQDSTGSRTVAGFGADVMLAGNAFSVTSNAERYTTLTLEYDANDKWTEIGRTSDVY